MSRLFRLAAWGSIIFFVLGMALKAPSYPAGTQGTPMFDPAGIVELPSDYWSGDPREGPVVASDESYPYTQWELSNLTGQLESVQGTDYLVFRTQTSSGELRVAIIDRNSVFVKMHPTLLTSKEVRLRDEVTRGRVPHITGVNNYEDVPVISISPNKASIDLEEFQKRDVLFRIASLLGLIAMIIFIADLLLGYPIVMEFPH